MITGVTAGEDIFEISSAQNPKLCSASLAARPFWIGPQLRDAKDFIVYDQASGNLWYDPEGRAHLPAQLIRTIDPHGMTGMMSGSDFVIV